jgi:hypothetical protein
VNFNYTSGSQIRAGNVVVYTCAASPQQTYFTWERGLAAVSLECLSNGTDGYYNFSSWWPPVCVAGGHPDRND